MNLLREYIRGILTESTVHPKIMSMIDKAESLNILVYVRGDRVFFMQNDEKKVGGISWSQDIDFRGPCFGAQVVDQSRAEYGLGPLVYDVAIEATGGLTPDRTSVSGEARAVWRYYHDQRDDVRKDQLDDLSNYLTDDPEDNCDQLAASKDGGHNSEAGRWNWEESPLSKVYKKSGTPVIDELQARGMLRE